MRRVVVVDSRSSEGPVDSVAVMNEDGLSRFPARKMILVAAGVLSPGSVAEVIFDTIEAIPDYRFLIWVTPREKQTSLATLRQRFNDVDRGRPANLSLITSPSQANRLAPEIASTFLHLFSADDWYMPFSLEKRIPIATFSHSVSYFEDYPFLSSPSAPEVAWQRRAYLLATRVVCWSNLEKEFITRFLPIVKRKVAVVPLCQTFPAPSRGCRRASPRRHPKVLFVGRPLAKRKGFEHLARALQELVAEGWEIELTVADAFTNSERIARVRFADALRGIAVKWLSDLDRERMRSVYRSAHVVVIPSLYDSWCKALTEAIAEGTPVIATDATGSTELFPTNEIPRVKAGDGAALAKAIKQLLVEYPRFLAATKKARQRLMATLTLEKYGARLREAMGLDYARGVLREALFSPHDPL